MPPTSAAVTKNELAYRTVRERILTGEYAPGSVINQVLIAADIGVSTTPLREALRRLNSEGLVEIDAHHNAKVRHLTSLEARELFEIRESLDSSAAGLAALRRTEGDLEIIQTTASELQPLNASTGPNAVAIHRRFHSAIYHASHNTTLIEMLDMLWDKMDRYRSIGLEMIIGAEATRLRDFNEHFLLLEAIAEQNSVTAQNIMARHIRESLGAQAVKVLSTTPESNSPRE